MTTTANKALVTRYYDEVLNQRNLAALDDLLGPNFASWLPDGTRIGRAQYRPVTITAMHPHRVADGKLTEHWEETCRMRCRPVAAGEGDRHELCAARLRDP